MLLMNPRKRRRARKAARRARRPMTAKQLKYFGKRRHRRSARRRSSAPVVIHANPIRRRRSRRSAVAVARRRYRRNPIRMPSGSVIRASLGSVTRMATGAAVGGAGAVLADVSMGYLLQALPATLVAKVGTRYGADGAPNLAYYGVKLGMMTALGIAGSRFLPAKMRSYAAKATEGALTVGAYEMLRLMLPANIALGYYSAAPVVTGSAINPTGARRSSLGAYTGRRALAGMGGTYHGSAMNADMGTEGRVGEAAVR